MLSEVTVAFHTLGCKVNQSDTARLEDVFIEAGFRPVTFEIDADVYVVNSCTVTSTASRKSRQLVRAVRRRSPGALVVMMGCYPEVARKRPGTQECAAVSDLPADLVFGVESPDVVVAKVRRSLAETSSGVGVSHRSPGPTDRPVVVATRGCDGGCTYCIVPIARGPLASTPPNAVIEEIRRFVAQGSREVVLAGIHLGAYGRDLDPPTGLGALLSGAVEIPGNWRLRLSSLEPMDLQPALLEFILESERIAPHLHLPLQSGSDAVLRRMGRTYSAEEYRGLVDRARSLDPRVGVTTDIMVGFPGETEADHRRSLEFVREMRFGRLHVFPFSPRPGTVAAELPGRVHGSVVRARRDAFLAVAEECALAFHRAQVGREAHVLLETRVSNSSGGDGMTVFRGYSGNYAPMHVRGEHGDAAGDLVPVAVRSADREGCWADSLSETVCR